jgi:hypothetical protein
MRRNEGSERWGGLVSSHPDVLAGLPLQIVHVLPVRLEAVPAILADATLLETSTQCNGSLIDLADDPT